MFKLSTLIVALAMLGVVASALTFEEAEATQLAQQVQEFDFECDTCKLAVVLVRHYVKKNDSIEYVTEKVEMVCSLMPEEYQVLCIAAVEMYVPEMIEDLSAMTGEEICEKIKLCSAESRQLTDAHAMAPVVIRALEALEASPECEKCVEGISEAQQYFVDSVNVQEMEELLSATCATILDAELASVCSSLAGDFAQYATAFSTVAPQQLCKEVSMCDAAAAQNELILDAAQWRAFAALSKLTAPASVDKSVKCLACEGLVSVLKLVIGTVGVENTTKLIVDNVCPVLGSFEATCTQYAATAVGIINVAPANYACQMVKAC